MIKKPLCFLAIGLAVTVCLWSTTQTGNYSQTPRNYVIKAYSGGAVVANYDVTNNGSGSRDGSVYAYLASNRKVKIVGIYSVRRTDPGNAGGPSGFGRYHAILYSGGQAVETVDTYGYSTGDGRIYLSVNGSRSQIIFGGTFVLKDIGVNLNGIADTAHFKITAYSNGVVIGTWYADSYYVSDHLVFARIWGVKDALVLAGEYTVEEIR